MHAVHQRLLKFLRTISIAELVQPDSNWARQLEGLAAPAERGGPAASV
jgi:hypothetical protein